MKKFILFATMALSASGLSQVYSQPWVDYRPSYPSVVKSCTVPFPMPSVGMDDFILTQSIQLNQIVWWGFVTGPIPNPPQLNRMYYIAIYQDDNCIPNIGSIIWESCVIPTARYVGVDCEGLPIYRFAANVPPGLPLLLNANQTYWIQISESDAHSVRPTVRDFCWSSHAPIRNCPATLRFDSGLFSILEDPCYKPDINDFAFELY